MRDSLLIYRSFYEAIKDLPQEKQGEVWNAIFEYALNFKSVDDLTGMSKTIFTLIKPLLDANIKNYTNGLKPKRKRKGSEEEAKRKPEISQVEAKDKPSQSEREGNVNVNVNDNVNENKGAIVSIISHLNLVVGSKFRTDSEKTNGYINARLKEGYTTADFLAVIDNQHRLWAHDTKMCEYLRPLTLFNSEKFEGYLNSARINKVEEKPVKKWGGFATPPETTDPNEFFET